MKLYILILLIVLLIYFNNNNKNNEKFSNKNNGTIILFYATWCGHCSEFKPIWNELKENENENYEFIEIENDDLEKRNYKNEIIKTNINKIDIKGFPTIVYIKNNNIYYIKNRLNIIEEISKLN